MATFSRFAGVIALAAMTLGSNISLADDAYPARPVNVVLPFGAGGGTDILTRAWADKLSKMWNQSVVVENKPGASGNLGTEVVADSKPDGYTLLMTTNATIVINPQLSPEEVNYDPQKDLDPVTLVASVPFLLLVNPASPAKTIQDFIQLAKDKPGTLNCASSGIGGGAHLALELLKSKAGIDIVHVPYKGGNEGFIALMGGHVDCLIVSILTSTSYIQQGQVRALAVTSLERNPAQPDVPAFSELPGLEGFQSDLWYGLLAPAGTDKAVIQKVYEDTKKVLTDPDYRKQFEPTGAVLVGNTPEEFKKVIAEDMERWKEVIEISGVRNQL
jgi:tripartite-type tricarboxylate transporter receptor subunit TctC